MRFAPLSYAIEKLFKNVKSWSAFSSVTEESLNIIYLVELDNYAQAK